MKHYIVAIISFFDNEIKQYQVESDSQYEAVKKGLLEFCGEENRASELEWQESEDYPTEIAEMHEYLANAEIGFSVVEVGSFI